MPEVCIDVEQISDLKHRAVVQALLTTSLTIKEIAEKLQIKRSLLNSMYALIAPVRFHGGRLEQSRRLPDYSTPYFEGRMSKSYLLGRQKERKP